MGNGIKKTVIVWLIITTLVPLGYAAGGGGKRSSGHLDYKANELFPAFESYYHPRVRKLKKRYGLDKIVKDESDEFKRIMLLRHWIHTQMPIDDYNPTQTRMEAFAILDAALAGDKFNCSHFSIVQNAVLNSFGYITRLLGVGPGANPTGIDGHHATNEVWVNSLGKWVMVDAKYDLHFEKNGIPLSALEIRDEVWRNNARDVSAAFGLERKSTVPQINDRDWGIWATPQNYRWASWQMKTNGFTTYPAGPPGSAIVMYADEIFKNHVWIRSGKPHWAYNTPYLITTERRDWIYWTPNTISARKRISENHVTVDLTSFTPNFQTYQVRVNSAPWRDCAACFEIDSKEDKHLLVFRTVNLFGVTGPEHRVEVVHKKRRFW